MSASSRTVSPLAEDDKGQGGAPMPDVARHERERERIRTLARRGQGYELGPCKRCGHGSDDHRLDDALNVSPVSPEAEYRCVGHQEGDRWIDTHCDCPDYVQNIVRERNG